MINRLTGKDEKSVKVVIEILEDDYKNLMLYKDHSDSRSWAEIAIINGIPLPKGHGRLIDADKTLKRHCVELCKEKLSCHEDCLIYDLFHLAPTIIEAD